MYNIAVYAGSFDPFTVGHLEVVKKAAEVFDEVVVAIGVNPNKVSRRFPIEGMLKAIEKTLIEEYISNVVVVYTEDLIADYASKVGAKYIVKGLRTTTDYAYEEDLAEKNMQFAGIDTIYFRAGKYGYVSSSYVMELFNRGFSVDTLVSKQVLEYMRTVCSK